MLKKITGIFILFWILSISTASAQQFNAGLKLGINANQINGDNMAGFNHIGFNGGMFVNYQFNNKWDAGFEMLFSQKGSRGVRSATSRDSGLWFKLTLNYVEVPLMVSYYVSPKFKIMAGPGVGYLISSTEHDTAGNGWSVNFIKKVELNFTVGAAYFVTPRFALFARYTNSILPIGKTENYAYYFGHQIGGLTNLNASFGIYYNFLKPKGTK